MRPQTSDAPEHVRSVSSWCNTSSRSTIDCIYKALHVSLICEEGGVRNPSSSLWTRAAGLPSATDGFLSATRFCLSDRESVGLSVENMRRSGEMY
ncbi:hypothetical protein CgunFtcFv8_023959 [Champsocephalus gunnari]|uniref:Uncharacterized protein n=1 Tax=Champsocephalus gunnari TaxID=52237 RepID=A0AAN8HKV4_CHAGU|nr:hypothetical protein CgunFtcFv8_023959 [Champsocephalus gunnari]